MWCRLQCSLAAASGAARVALAASLLTDLTSPNRALCNSVHVTPGGGSMASKRYQGKVFTGEEIRAHSSVEDGLWVTYRGEVYDVTRFIEAHPGGQLLLHAAGGPADDFVRYWATHLDSPHFHDALRTLHIGSVHPKDRGEFGPSGSTLTEGGDSPYDDEPARDDLSLLVLTRTPFMAETPREMMGGRHYHTPNQSFYVRNHAPVPRCDVGSHRVHVEVDGHALALSIDDLKNRFPRLTVDATIQCTGNRLDELALEKGVDSVSDAARYGGSCGYMSNARWTGARMSDILSAAGLSGSPASHGAAEMEVVGEDGYGCSIPLGAAADPERDVIIAYEMNGKPLPPDHGYPVRLVAPGMAGARHVKWLSSVRVIPHPSELPWQACKYRRDGKPILEWPVTSFITSHQEGDSIAPTPGARIHGVAYSGGGRAVARVEVSVDGGQSWQDAERSLGPELPGANKAWAWTLWSADIGATAARHLECRGGGGSEVEVRVRATDETGHAQPARAGHVDGYLFNAVQVLRLKTS